MFYIYTVHGILCMLGVQMCVGAHAIVLVWSLRSMLGGFPGQAPPSAFLRQEDFLANLKSISLMRLDGIDLWSSTYLISECWYPWLVTRVLGIEVRSSELNQQALYLVSHISLALQDPL